MCFTTTGEIKIEPGHFEESKLVVGLWFFKTFFYPCARLENLMISLLRSHLTHISIFLEALFSIKQWKSRGLFVLGYLKVWIFINVWIWKYGLHTQSLLSDRYWHMKLQNVSDLWVGTPNVLYNVFLKFAFINVLTIELGFSLSPRVRSVFWGQMSTSSHPVDWWKRTWSSHSHYRQALWHYTVNSHTYMAVTWRGDCVEAIIHTPSKPRTKLLSSKYLYLNMYAQYFA